MRKRENRENFGGSAEVWTLDVRSRLRCADSLSPKRNNQKPSPPIPPPAFLRIMAAASAAAVAPADYPMNALRSTALRRSTLHWDAAAAFFCPPFRSRRCRHRVLPPPAAALPAKSRSRARAKLPSGAGAGDPWLASLSLLPADDGEAAPVHTGWALGIDPDTGGAIAVLSPDGSSQVFDNPFVHIVVSEFTRKRLDTKSIIQLLRGLDAPLGTTAYIEKSSPFPTDGKLGWWSTGFSYGLWIAALVASGFSVVPVASQTWKAYFGLTRSKSRKDDSRQAATILFPDKALSLKLKKHHGRAEALLLAAYGKGLVLPSEQLPTTQIVHKQETNLTLTGRLD